MNCLDTYALVEIHDGNPRFLPLLKDEIAIADPTLAEFFGLLYKRHGLKTAEYWKKRLGAVSKAVPLELLVKAVRLRIDSKRNLSFFDCAGYIFARENGSAFVTGDRGFKGMEGVLLIR